MSCMVSCIDTLLLIDEAYRLKTDTLISSTEIFQLLEQICFIKEKPSATNKLWLMHILTEVSQQLNAFISGRFSLRLFYIFVFSNRPWRFAFFLCNWSYDCMCANESQLPDAVLEERSRYKKIEKRTNKINKSICEAVFWMVWQMNSTYLMIQKLATFQNPPNINKSRINVYKWAFVWIDLKFYGNGKEQIRKGMNIYLIFFCQVHSKLWIKKGEAGRRMYTHI